MTMFTMSLKRVVENTYGTTMDPLDYEQPYGSLDFNGVTYGKLPLLSNPEKIGLGTYPIFDEKYRPILNGKILDEYWNREIGSESIDDFTLIIRRKLDQIMPFYNKMYLSEQIDYDALATMDIRSQGTSAMNGTESSDTEATTVSETDGKARVVQSQTPQTMLKPNADYATAATDTNSESDVSGSSTSHNNGQTTNNSNSENRVTGYQGIASDLIMKYRASLINIDTMILSDIEDCFMLILSTGDSFANNERWYF